MIDTLEIWHALVCSRDMQSLHDLLADDVVFHSPVVHAPQRGEAITVLYLTGDFGTSARWSAPAMPCWNS